MMIFPLSGVSIPAIQRRVMLLPLPDAPSSPMAAELPSNFTFREKSRKFFFDIYADCHQIHLLVFIPLPDTILINATIAKDISTITTTQKPAVP